MIMLLSFWGASVYYFVTNVKFPIIYVVDVQIIIIKRVYGRSGYYRKGLHQGARIFFFFGVCAVHVVLCSLYFRDRGGICLCQHLCCGVIVVSGM